MSYQLRDDLAGKLRPARAAARAGGYQLLLGAGASLGATNSYGALPKSSELVIILAKRFPKAPIDETDSLSRAYQRAVLASSAQTVWVSLREIMTNSTHLQWFNHLVGFPWRRIWTLNVDDTVENAYLETPRSHASRLRTISWDDPYSETGDLEVVHLHGHVISRDPKPLVFSFSEYQAAAQEKPVWGQVLAGVLGSEPVVCLGARLLDDPDVEGLLMTNKPADAAPSMVVDPYISPGNAWELERLGYIIVRQPAEVFTEAWRTAFDFDESSLASIYATTTVELPQIHELQTNRVTPAPRAHDYFSGDEPLWMDAVENRPALFGWVRKILREVEEWLEKPGPKSHLHIMYARRLTGLSSGLYVVAREVRRQHITVLEFDKSSRFNVSRLLDYCRRAGPVLLLVDGASEFGDDLDQLLRAAGDDAEVELYCLVSALPYEYLRLEGRLTGHYSKHAEQVPASLNRDDAHALAVRLFERGRLGALEPLEPLQRVGRLRNRDVFSAMMDVEQAAGFRRRVEAELRALDKSWKSDLVLLLAVSSEGNREVGVQEAAFATGLSVNQIVDQVGDDSRLGALIEIVPPLLFSRQRATAVSLLISVRGASESLDALSRVVRALAPLGTRQGLRERNRAAVLLGQLMGAKLLSNIFGSQDIDGFYESLRTTFGDWNGRYWEQRAIHAKSKRDWPQAESYAARAVSLYEDAFTRTTYGTILINRAEEFAEYGNEKWFDFYERGKKELDRALEHEPDNRITKFAFLQATLAVLSRLKDGAPAGDTPLAERTRDVAGDWRGSYTALRLSLSDESGFETVRRAEQLSHRYEQLGY